MDVYCITHNVLSTCVCLLQIISIADSLCFCIAMACFFLKVYAYLSFTLQIQYWSAADPPTVKTINVGLNLSKTFTGLMQDTYYFFEVTVRDR